MWKPLKLLPWFAAVGVAWGLGYVYNVRYGGELSWLRMMYEDKIAAAEKIQAPHRLIITGGSGAHYTINSEVISQGLGIPVLNLGLDGPIGLDVILPSIIDEVKPGDTVLLIPEYLLLMDDDGLGDRSVAFGVAIGKPRLGNISLKKFAQDSFVLGVPTLRALTKSALDVIEKGRMTGYYSDPVNSNGDPTAEKYRTGNWWQMTFKDTITPHAIARITQFRQEVEAKGGKLILSLPWVYADTSDQETVSNIRKTADELGKIAPLIYEPNTLNLKTDSSLFADTHYHLIPEARKIRSQEIVQQIKPLLIDNEK